MTWFDFIRRSKEAVVAQEVPMRSNNPYQKKDVSVLAQQYRLQLQRLNNAIPLSESERNECLQPLINDLMRWIQLLPASESHHHSYPGGLLIHSLEGAYFASQLASYHAIFKSESPRQKYQNRERWIVAAVVMLLIHDVGKVFDMDVQDEHAHRWNPNQGSLFDWLEQRNSQEYFVEWVEGRQHKAHELRSLRMAYRWLLPDVLIRYLSADTRVPILSGIEEAIVFGRGPLAEILRQAEAQSIDADQLSRHQDERLLLRLPSVVGSVLNIIHSFLKEGTWSVNQPDSFVFVTDEGVFLRLVPSAVESILDEASSQGIKRLPTTQEGLTKILADAGLLIGRDGRSDVDGYSWMIYRGNGEPDILNCLLFKSPFALFDAKSLPSPISVCTTRIFDAGSEVPKQCQVDPMAKEVLIKEESIEPTEPVKDEEACCTSFEVHRVLLEPLTDDELKRFVPRLLNTVVEHCLQKGYLGRKPIEVREGYLCVSSHALERVLKNHKISQKVVQICAKLRTMTPKIEIDFVEHRIILIWK